MAYQYNKSYPSKESTIKKAIENKEKSIAKYTDNKSASIAISSAFNGASALCTALVANKAIEFIAYWEMHEKLYNEYLEKFAIAQVDGVDMYNQFKGRRDEIRNKHLEEINIEVGNEDEPDGGTQLIFEDK